ncbi:MAG: class II SORL domain-containing protein [Candidatus Omnitrophota bacterium]|nr:class II SORL domain-containing protein [Candidatus Omnitrophota bacterium]MDD5525954.1 class II SORL domain-containing protein [Candidatus Omnitrophota bacterium]
MTLMKDLFQNADWKTEKHVPAIDLPLQASKDGTFEIIVTVGRQIPHPNTSAHHIAYIEVYFLPQGEKFPYQAARCEFPAHGASTQGADTSGVYSLPEARVKIKTEKPGTVVACAYCNIHGLWENSAVLTIG